MNCMEKEWDSYSVVVEDYNGTLAHNICGKDGRYWVENLYYVEFLDHDGI